MRIHRKLGLGLLESATKPVWYSNCEKWAFASNSKKHFPDLRHCKVGMWVSSRPGGRQQSRVELKCKEALHPVDHAQVLSHLRLLGLQMGLLINFQVVVLKDGVRRIVNQSDGNLESQSARRKSAEDAEKI
jgi:hypothetical protein